jgi:hypothetical protein
MAERFHRARVAFAVGAYSEFLALVIGLVEAALQQAVHTEVGIDYHHDDPRARAERGRQIAERPALQAFLDTRPPENGRPFDYLQSNAKAMRACLEFALPAAEAGGPDESTRTARIRRLLEIQGWLGKSLQPMRNRGIHQDGGASREGIERAYAEVAGARGDLIADLSELATLAGAATGEWALEAVREALRSQLGK